MQGTKVKQRPRGLWERVRGAPPWVGLVALVAPILGVLIAAIGYWFNAEARARDAQRATIRLEREVTELGQRSRGLEAALRECSRREEGAADGGSERALQFYVTDTEGHPVVSAAVSALRTRERVVTRESGLTDRLIVRLADKIAIARDGFESRELTVSESELEGLVVNVELRR